MRLLLLTLLAATVASAQPRYAASSSRAEIDRLDRQIAAIDREIAHLDDELYRIDRDLDGVRDTEAGLDGERVRFQDAIRAYQRDAEAYRADADRARAMYDDLVRYGGSQYDREAYEDARYRIEDDAERLRGEARMLNEWNAELNAGYFGHADRVRQSAGRGQRLAQQRADLRHERDVLAARRARLARRR